MTKQQSPANEWIETKDKLPAFGQSTIIWRDGSMYIATFVEAQVYGNNTVPYAWRGPGPFEHFGNEVKYWMPTPAPPA